MFKYFVTVFWQVYFAELWKKCGYALNPEYRMIRKQLKLRPNRIFEKETQSSLEVFFQFSFSLKCAQVPIPENLQIKFSEGRKSLLLYGFA